MKRYIKSNEFVFPEEIEIERYPNVWVRYHKQYVHEGGGCYYESDDLSDVITGNFVSMYPDGSLTYVWNGREKPWNVRWREV